MNFSYRIIFIIHTRSSYTLRGIARLSMQSNLTLGKNIDGRSGSGCARPREEACWQVDIPVERRRAPFIARGTTCSHDESHKFLFERSRSPILRAPLKTRARPTLLKRMRYRFYSLTLHNFTTGFSSPYLSPVVHTFTGNYARCGAHASTSHEQIIYSRCNVSVHEGQREMQTL